MTTMWRIVVTLAALVGVGAVTRLPLGARERAAAELRLSWRMRAEPERVCRIRTAEELARLPAHMREEEICERRSLPYRLKVTVDEAVLEDRQVVAAGAHGDRPLYVFERFTLQPGARAVRIELTREGGEQAGLREHARGGEAPTHALPPIPPLQLVLDTTLTFAGSEVRVVTYDEQGKRLRVIGVREP